ncbi:MAG: DegT/DnrJ/EryC1/StrS family aminotransferase [Candidatus Sumerlaeia bacterium]|nr:DegT/DnrJ/EryC1/StrS family aminotransferase [Candidatus Sumerlaeia bacterium]
MVPFVNLSAMHAPLQAEFERVFREIISTSAFIGGRAVADFERAFAHFCGVNHAVAAGSGTAALHMALAACGIGPGDEVITTAHTFAATVEGILHAGATPVFVDVDEETYTIAPEQIEAVITPRTRAILPVHLYGQCADMEAIGAVARRHNLLVIEDAAQAHGARIGDRRAGSFGDMACFSFYPAKNLGAFGDAGMVVTNDPEKARIARLLADHGSPDKYHHTLLGYNYRCDALQAAVLSVKLPHLEAWNERRRRAAARYTEQLRDVPGVRTPRARFDHIYHLYVIRVTQRDALKSFLGQRNIATGLHYPVPMHLQPMMTGHPQARVGALPVTERIVGEILSLPMFPDITDAQVDEVAAAVREFLEKS